MTECGNCGKPWPSEAASESCCDDDNLTGHDRLPYRLSYD